MFKVSKKTLQQHVKYVQSLLSIVSFELILQSILQLLLLNSSKYSETLVSDNTFVFDDREKYIGLSARKIWLGYIFSSLFTQHKVPKGYIFTTVLHKDKSNPDHL